MASLRRTFSDLSIYKFKKVNKIEDKSIEIEFETKNLLNLSPRRDVFIPATETAKKDRTTRIIYVKSFCKR